MEPALGDLSLHLDVIRTEGDRLASMPVEMLHAPVPSLADWTIERVVRHVGRIHRWATGLLGAPADADPDAVAAAAPSLPRGPDCLSAYRHARDEMLDVFETTDPNRHVASFVGLADVAFWARRQAHELTVHRIDAADALRAAGGSEPEPVNPVAAADGVAEWQQVFATSRHRQKTGAYSPELRGHTFGFAVTDVGPRVVNHWTLDYVDSQRADIIGLSGNPTTPAQATDQSTPGNDTPAPTHLLGDADVVLAGPAGTLLLTLWRRRPLDAVSVTGDRALAQTFLDIMGF